MVNNNYNTVNIAPTEGDAHEDHGHVDPQIYRDEQLAFLIDPVLEKEDVNRDGFIDYAEFIAATMKKRLKASS